MSESNEGLVRMNENKRSGRDDVTLGCNGVQERHRKLCKQPVYNNVELIYLIQFGYSRCNRMKDIDNLKIEDEGRPPCWILAFAVYRLSYRNSNFEETHQIW